LRSILLWEDIGMSGKCLGASRYTEVYESWKRDPEGFWAEAAREIDWIEPPKKIFDAGQGIYGRWFTGGVANTAYNCLDRHVERGRGDQGAVIYDSPVTGTKRIYTYAEMLGEVAAFAGVLLEMGVGKGDRVIVYMPMIPEALVAMLACARIGAIHSVVFGGFAAHELAVRIEDAQPKAIVSASCGIEPNRIVSYKPLLDQAIELSSAKPDVCIIVQRPEQAATLIAGRDYDYASLMASARSRSVHARCEPVAATDPLYILYTSGTTGRPKGVVRDTGGHMAALKWTMPNHYDIDPGDVFWAASDVGWVVGHSYIVYAPLLHGATTIVYEGKPVGTPDAGAFWRVISEHKVKALFTAPTAFRAIKKEDPKGSLRSKYNLSHFKTLFLAGERADPNTVQWAEELLGVPVIDHWWQTETGWTIAGNCAGLGAAPVKRGSAAFPVPGYELHVLNESNEEVSPGDTGALSIRLPMPPGCLPTLWQNDRGFIESYLTEYPGYYKTADAGYIDEDGYVFVMSRTDDIINVAGHRLSTGGIEEVLSNHPDVAECAVIGVADGLKGHIPAGFILLKSGVTRDAAGIEQEIVELVRERIGPVAAFKTVLTVSRLPKTRSGKILRGTMRKIADGEEYKMPATIEDPAVLAEIAAALKAKGFPSASGVA
jgi:propionyl-CoA synthetase